MNERKRAFLKRAREPLAGDRESFAEQLTEGMSLLGMTPREAATIFRTAPGTVTRWVAGHSAPPMDARRDIIDILRLNVGRARMVESQAKPKKFLFKVELGLMVNVNRDQAMYFLKKTLRGLKDVKVSHLRLAPKKTKVVKGVEAAVQTSEIKAAVADAPRKKLTVVCQDWLESEAGWGQRPDGVSLHLTESDRVAYCKAYWSDQPGRDANGNPPHEYSREDGSPFLVEVEEGDEFHAGLLQAQTKGKYGIRIWDREALARLKKD
jgi:hypothetical protein